MSKFLKFNRERFTSGMKEIPGDPVPWILDDKAAAYRHVAGLGYSPPENSTYASLEDALKGAEGRFVIKGSGGHSGKNVYVLERLGEDMLLDLVHLRIWSHASIADNADKNRSKYWIREKCVPSLVYGRAIPFDYKFDCFNHQIVTITQIDRNFWPPRVAIFDGAFVPLTPKRDYHLDTAKWDYGAPVLPLHASRMIEMARTLSISTRTAYVRVDCFDGFDGPVFGEFTFASGPPNAGMVAFSDDVLSKYDAALEQRQVERISGFDIDYTAFWLSCKVNSPRISDQDDRLIGRIMASASIRNSRYKQQIEIAPIGRLGSHYLFCASIASRLAGDRTLNFTVQELIRVRSGFIMGPGREREFMDLAKEYYGEREREGFWYVVRKAEVDANRGDPLAIKKIEEVAALGYGYAQRVIERIKG